ncbi:MAG TPA: SGNH/GDSL hydrolase family protein [Streptosporangiaceae bacterium]|nr:SGNH/GDSL hydrolase family protein [Streptosporangiaceae bacterium]
MTTFVALGDSITLGIGDPVRLPPVEVPGVGRAPRKGPRGWRGWAVLLAETVPACALHNVAGNGACMAELERDQLPRALRLRPDVASVVIGVNDTLRPNFDPDRIGAAAAHTIGALRASGADVLTMRLPDPGRMLGVPGVLARPLARRAHQVNDVMDQMAARFGTLHFDAATDAAVYDPGMWAVDRLHPSERGHRLIARRFHALLAQAGHQVGPPPGAEPLNQPPTKAEQLAWMATKGTAWVARRSTDLVPSLLAMAFAEWRSGQAADPELAGQELRDPAPEAVAYGLEMPR